MCIAIDFALFSLIHTFHSSQPTVSSSAGYPEEQDRTTQRSPQLEELGTLLQVHNHYKIGIILIIATLYSKSQGWGVVWEGWKGWGVVWDGWGVVGGPMVVTRFAIP